MFKPAFALVAGVFALFLSAGGGASTARMLDWPQLLVEGRRAGRTAAVWWSPDRGRPLDPVRAVLMRFRMAVPAFFLLVLVLTAARGAVGATSSPAIFEIRGDGSARRLVGGVGALGFALSKGGMRLSFFRGSSEQRSIWVVNRDGSGERQLVADTRAEPILIEFPLAWSPKGDALAYTTASCPEPCTATRVVIVEAQDGHRLGEIDRADSLRWSADGRRMVWACDTEPDPYGEVEAVCFTLRKGGAVQRVSARRNFVNRPLPSPDGERVAFTGLGGGPLSVLDLRRRSVRVIADPASSIDGGHVVAGRATACIRDRGERALHDRRRTAATCGSLPRRAEPGLGAGRSPDCLSPQPAVDGAAGRHGRAPRYARSAQPRLPDRLVHGAFVRASVVARRSEAVLPRQPLRSASLVMKGSPVRVRASASLDQAEMHA